MSIFVREGLVCGDFMCGGIRYFRAIGNTFLVHSRKFVSVKLQRMFAFLSSLGAILSYLKDYALPICTFFMRTT